MIFIDTSAFYALEVSTDKNHSKARAFLKELRENKYGRLITSDYVLDETYTLLRIGKNSDVAVNFLRKVLKSQSIDIIWVDEVIFKEGVNYAKRFKNLRISFTDCISFTIMKLMNIKTAFTFDEHFKKAGFFMVP